MVTNDELKSMNLHRFYCNPINKPVTELTGAESRHLVVVRRLATGDKVELFDGRGMVAKAAIKTVSSKKVTLQVEEVQVFEKPVVQIMPMVGQRLNMQQVGGNSSRVLFCLMVNRLWFCHP